MPRYVAFLRGVNVGGRTIRMQRLREIFTGAGFSNVETFIASGNVIFDARSTNTPALERKIESALESALQYPVATFVRRAQDLGAIVEHQPFPIGDGGKPDGTMYVIFLRGPLGAVESRTVLTLRTDVDDLDVKGREIYWLVRGKLTDSKLTMAGPERKFGPTTVRNRNTIVRLAAKLQS